MQHETLLRVRKEGNAHEKYNSFRSAFEVLETIGKPPADDIEKHYQRPMSLLAKVERLEQELAQQKQESVQQMARAMLQGARHLLGDQYQLYWGCALQYAGYVFDRTGRR